MNEKISAVNIGLMIDTQMIILELIHRRVNSFIENANNSSEYIEDMNEELSEALEDEDEILTLGDECDEDVTDDIEALINKIDKERSAYYKSHTGREWTDIRNYDLCLNTGDIGIDKCVDIICDYLKISGIERQ